MCWNEVRFSTPLPQSPKISADKPLPYSLARAELNLTLATVFRRYDRQQLFESSRLDVNVKHDFLLPQQDKKSKGVKVIFK
jgi:hypothetical protein